MEYKKEDYISYRLSRSDEAIKDAVMALFGAWANREDMDDSWLDNLRAQMEKGWRERLVELYGNEELSI